MADKIWKYDDLTADERLERIKNGDKDVFEVEKERTLSVINDRVAQGLDISEQIKWADNIGYNRAVATADVLGLNKNLLDKTGYLEKWENEPAAKSSTSANIYEIKNKLIDDEYASALRMLENDAENQKKEAYSNALDKVPIMRERFANLGLSPEGGTVRSEELEFNTALDNALLQIDKMLANGKLSLSSQKKADKLAAVSELLKGIRDEEQTEYQRGLDKAANERANAELELKRQAQSSDNEASRQEYQLALEKQKLASEEAKREYELALEKLALDKENANRQYELDKTAQYDKSEIEAVKLLTQAVMSEKADYYIRLLDDYSGDFFEKYGVNTAKINEKKPTKSELFGALMIFRSMQTSKRSEAELKKYYQNSGLSLYYSYEELTED